MGFFFQAEDGIRAHCVTGVQTCALPICELVAQWFRPQSFQRAGVESQTTEAARILKDEVGRSEERRVGKECRSGGLPHREKKRSDDATCSVDGPSGGRQAEYVHVQRVWW